MHISVRLYASLREGHEAEEELEVPTGSTIASVIETLNVAANAVTLTFINGRHGSLETVLHDSDHLALFPPVGGG